MNLPPAAFEAVAAVTFRDAALSPDDARAIVAIANILVEADDREDEDELSVLSQLTAQVWALAGGDPGDTEILFTADADERREQIQTFGGQLASRPARELAFGVAYLISISDLDLAPAETELVNELAATLGISDERADEIAAQVAASVTPPA